MIEDINTQAKKLTNRARAHGVELVAGEPVLEIVRKLVDRLDLYRDAPQAKGRLLIE